MLGVLRSEDRPEALEPQPGIGQIERLVAQVRDAGLAVELEIKGWPRTLSRGADLTAYRMVQEALTNTLKHAGQARAWISLTYGDHDLEIEVRDYGRGAMAGLKGSGAGQGLVGMHERALLYGGSLEVGPTMSGGWRVLARLPIEDSDTPSTARHVAGVVPGPAAPEPIRPVTRARKRRRSVQDGTVQP